MHLWGDSWPHWDQLYKSENNINKKFEERTGLVLLSKEKYGTVRYEHIVDPKTKYSFADTKDNWMILKEIVFEEIEEYPEIKDELLSDLAAHEELIGIEIHKHYWRSA